MLPRMLAVSGVGGSHVAAIQVSRITSHDLRVLHAGATLFRCSEDTRMAERRTEQLHDEQGRSENGR